ncbi:DMT family transporter [Dongia soli]|uniref:DMT family transporter n=1 Tax=Dongia soli TaxID=600628 RepID=A0ABU5E797_9PROT|nr:DMT family transporter [Dongia soli]MDY0882192.1 DMT family transporter [Dongia soli]
MKRGHVHGLVLVTASAFFWSTAGFFVRLLDLDVWTMLGWRSLFASLALLSVVVIQHRHRAARAFLAIGWPGLIAIPISALSMLGYVVALKLTTVANVMIVYAMIPFVSAGIAFLWIGERTRRGVLPASAVALFGILIMVGAAPRQDLAGNAMALLMTVTLAFVLVMARRYSSIAMAPVNCLAAASVALACWPLMASVVPSWQELIILALFGITTTALAYLLFLTGGRHLPSSEASLVALLDVVLAPLWVWLAFSERPDRAAFIGGGFVLAAVVWYLLGELRRNRAAATHMG